MRVQCNKCMEILLSVLTLIIFQVIICYVWHQTGYKKREKEYEKTLQFTYWQGDEPALTVKKKECYYEVKIYSKDHVVVK